MCASAGAAEKTADPWKPFDLATTSVGPLTVRYDKALVSQMDAIKTGLKGFLDDQAKRSAFAEKVIGRYDAIAADLNAILRASHTEKQKARLREAFAFWPIAMRLFDPDKVSAVIIVTRARTKDYLRKGGKLPHFTYDRAADMAEYEFSIKRHVRDADRHGKHSLVIPVRGGNAAEDVKDFRAGVAEGLGAGIGLPFQLLAGLSLQMRLRPADPYHRWFTDGFAAAIAIRLLEKHAGQQEADRFAAAFDVKPHAALRKELYLFNWLASDYTVDVPLESEQKLLAARRAYAAAEAQRLIAAHGIECVGKILGEACKGQGARSVDLLAAIIKVTGDDPTDRIKLYTRFEKRSDAVKHHLAAWREAIGRKEYAAAVPHALRLMELGDCDNADLFAGCCGALALAGHEKAADSAFIKRLNLLGNSGCAEALLKMQHCFMAYAFGTSPAKAHELAERVLNDRPDDVWALAVRVHRLGTSGKMDQARKTARRIIELRPADKRLSALAEKALADAPKSRPGNR